MSGNAPGSIAGPRTSTSLAGRRHEARLPRRHLAPCCRGKGRRAATGGFLPRSGRQYCKASPLCQKRESQTRPWPCNLWRYSGCCVCVAYRASIVPGTPKDYYIVINHHGRFGTAFAETDLDRADYETAISDLMSGAALRSAARGDVQSRGQWVRGCLARGGLGAAAPPRA